MPRTLSVSTDADGVTDLDGTIADDLDSLAQRCEQAILHLFGTWFLDTTSGVRRELIQGHATTLTIAAATLTAAVRGEGGDEILSIETPVVRLDDTTRRMVYQARIETIYGPMRMATSLPL